MQNYLTAVIRKQINRQNVLSKQKLFLPNSIGLSGQPNTFYLYVKDSKELPAPKIILSYFLQWYSK